MVASLSYTTPGDTICRAYPPLRHLSIGAPEAERPTRFHGEIDSADQVTGLAGSPRAGIGDTVLVVDDKHGAIQIPDLGRDLPVLTPAAIGAPVAPIRKLISPRHA